MRCCALPLALALLTGCAVAPGTAPLSRAAGTLQASADLGGRRIAGPGVTVTPEDVEAAARTRALEWAPDAELRFVAWAVLRVEQLSSVNHTFYSPEKKAVMVVASFPREAWQKVVTYSEPTLVKPMDRLKPIGEVAISAQRALQLSAPWYVPGNTNPLRVLTLTHPINFVTPVWSVAAGGNLVHVNATNGRVIGIVPPGVGFPSQWSRAVR
ncbi:MAG: hypothetical protein VKQ33_08235 [Candidatus Sericytochromatia bacterium]|nr:hypothetical protein [Candidatus Sericytochromatia bacterium]